MKPSGTIEPLQYSNDFDRTIEIFKSLNLVYLSCLIEDPCEKSCYSIAQTNQLLQMVYYLLNEKYELNRECTSEYCRIQDPQTFENCLSVETVPVTRPKQTFVYDYLAGQSLLAVEDDLQNNNFQNK